MNKQAYIPVIMDKKDAIGLWTASAVLFRS